MQPSKTASDSAADDRYYAALAHCAVRYRRLLNQVQAASNPPAALALAAFIREFNDAIFDRAPLYKLNRWLGYIQGTLIHLGVTTVEAERDYTRPLFRPLDFPPQVQQP